MLIVPFNEFWQTNTTQASIKISALSLLKFPPCALCVNPFNHCSDLLSFYRRLIVPILEHHINRIIQYIFLVRLWGCVYQKFSPFFHHRTVSKFVKWLDTWEVSSLGLLWIKFPWMFLLYKLGFVFVCLFVFGRTMFHLSWVNTRRNGS